MPPIRTQHPVRRLNAVPTVSPRKQAALPVPRETKLQGAVRELIRIAGERGPNAPLPKVRDLREQLGVSTYTLDTALSELERQRIIDRRHGIGIFVASGYGRKHICLICAPHVLAFVGLSPFWGQIIERISERATVGGEDLSIHFTQFSEHDGESDILRQQDSGVHTGLALDMAEGRIHGVIAVGITFPQARWIEKFGIPVVSFPGPSQHIVSLDLLSVIREGTADLLRRGCQRVAFWRTVQTVPEHIERAVQDHEKAMQEHADRFHAVFVEAGQSGADGGIFEEAAPTPTEQGFALVERFFGEGSDPTCRPDGIVLNDDVLTQSVLLALTQRGVEVGVDVQIATHANRGSPALMGWENRITRVEFDPAEIVQFLFDILEGLMEGRSPAVLSVVGTTGEYVTWITPQLRTPKNK